MKLVFWCVVAISGLLVSPFVGATQEPPAVDLTDPAEVAQSYVDACRDSDVQILLQVLHPEDPMMAMVQEAAEQMERAKEHPQFRFDMVLTEYIFLPLGLVLEDELLDSQQDDTDAEVTFRRTWVVDQKIVLVRLEDGTWRVKVAESIKATKGGEEAVFLTQIARARQESGEGGEGEAVAMRPPAQIWQSQERLRVLYRAMSEYAGEHDKRLPPADRWVDEIEPYVLDRAMFSCPAAPDQEYGYAMNVLASEQEIPQAWQERRELLVLFEWPGAARNAAVMPDELVGADSFWEDGRIAFAAADQNSGALPNGLGFGELRHAEELKDDCSSHLRLLAMAARKYAREHDGVLPAAESWQDELALYLLEEGAGEDVFACPAAPELGFAYAINKTIAGKNALELTDHGKIVLFFETDLNLPNAAGEPEQDMPPHGRHITQWDGRRMNQVAYLNGSTGSRYVDEGEPVE